MEGVKQVVGRSPQFFEFSLDANGNPVTTISAPAASKALFRGTTYTAIQLISAAAATCIIQATNDRTSAGYVNEAGTYVAPTTSNWVTLNTITLAGAGSDGFPNATAPTPSVTSYIWIRANVTVASAATQVIMGA